MGPITLNHWFQRNASRPFALLAVFIALVWLVHLWAFNSEISTQQREAARQLANLLSLSSSQKNRVLTESLLDSSHLSFAAEAAAMCNGGVVVASSNADNSFCGRPGSFFYPKMSFPIPGSGGAQLVTTYSRFGERSNIWRFFLFGLALTWGCYVLLYKIRERFWRDIFLPFQAGMMDDQPLPIVEFEQVRQKRKLIVQAKEREAVLQAVLEHKSKVAHNIKSPLRTLQLLLQSLKGKIPEREEHLLEGVADSVNDILGEQQAPFANGGEVSDALAGNPQPQEPELVLVSDFLDEVLAQKSAEYARQKAISLSVDQSEVPFGTFARVVRHEFLAILSNLVNNGVEAIGRRAGRVEIVARVKDGAIQIQVRDTGPGVPEDRREKIFEKGVSFKQGGTGFGLFHARQYLAQWQGTIQCLPSPQGAIFEIGLPEAKAPPWFADRVAALAKRNVIILDDNRLIHRVWKERFRNLPGMERARLHFLSSEEELEACLGEIAAEVSDTIILCDYDLNLAGKTGLDIVRAYGVASLTTMVTNNFQSGALIAECLREKIRILPKPCIHSVPITA
ncbi:MAG: sensor histidine kinase [Bacteriovoracia bacterium]